MSLTQKELIDNIQTNLQTNEIFLSKPQIQAVLEQLGEVVTQALKGNHDVTLPGLGKLKPAERPARTGRNPQTGESMEIAAKRLAKFGESKALSTALNS